MTIAAATNFYDLEPFRAASIFEVFFELDPIQTDLQKWIHENQQDHFIYRTGCGGPATDVLAADTGANYAACNR